MKDKISVTLSREVLAGMDRLAGSKQSRSAVIERVRERAAVQVRDLGRINAASDRLNSETADVLEYQAGRTSTVPASRIRSRPENGAGFGVARPAFLRVSVAKSKRGGSRRP
jgi:hypothetical protein